MIMKHFIIVKFAESVKIHELVEPIKDLFNKSLNIKGVTNVEVSMSNRNLPNRHDLMIKMELNPSALTEFDNSEIHKQWKSEYGKFVINKTIFDCD